MFRGFKLVGLILAALGLLIFSQSILAQSNELTAKMKNASNLVAAQKFSEAEAIYDELLAKYPGNIQVLVARGTSRSFQKKYVEADADFNSVLSNDPDNLSALIGSGYNSAWSGNYSRAEQQFQKAAAKDQNQIDAQKGLAYTALWGGNASTAVRRFTALIERFPRDAELRVGLGQALLKAGQKDDAARAFRTALETEPGRRDAAQGLEAAEAKPARSSSRAPRVDFTLLGGYTSSKIEGIPGRENKTGIRFAEFAIEPTRNTRLWVQYDNGLSLDNFALARSNRTVPTYIVGGLVSYKRHYLTKFAYGRRNLPGNIGQNLFDIEQVFFLPKGYSLDVGAVIGPREDKRTETVVHTGVGIPVGEKFSLHPTFFYAQSGLPGEKQFRGLLVGEYRFKNGFKMEGGYATGREYRPLPFTDRTVHDTFFKVSAPVAKYIRPQFMVRHEAFGSSSITMLSFGFTISNKDQR